MGWGRGEFNDQANVDPEFEDHMHAQKLKTVENLQLTRVTRSALVKSRQGQHIVATIRAHMIWGNRSAEEDRVACSELVSITLWGHKDRGGYKSFQHMSMYILETRV